MIATMIRELASRGDTKEPFLSLYIDTNRNDESQRDRIRLFLKHESQRIRESLGGNGKDAAALEQGIRQITDYVENSLEPETRGVVIFTCPGNDLFIPLQLPAAVTPELVIGSRPQLRQLIQLRETYPPVAVALVDAKYARLFDLQFGRILEEIDLENPDQPRRHDQGGWSQANMQRHVQDHIDRHHKDVAEVLTRIVERGNVRSVILSGQERNLANFRAQLPKRVQDKLIGTLHLGIRSTPDEVVEACRKLIQSEESVRKAQLLGSVEEFAQKNGRGALGLEAVIAAANERKLGSLFLSAAAAARGWKCRSCGILGLSVPLGCPACASGIVTVDLVEELIAAAEREDATVEFLEGESLLDRYQGIGALLRF